jgi:protein-tyrosine phosphatase
MNRAIRLESACNVRDLGGIAMPGGRMVKRGLLYRADGIHRATPSDVSLLVSLGIRDVFDLRSPDELERDGTGAFSGPVATHHHVPIVQVSLSPFDPNVDWLTVNLRDRYLEMLEQGGAAIRSVVMAAAAERPQPVLFHCSGGKDRTGVVAALILRSLGVADRDIVSDYAVSERNLAEKVRAFLGKLDGVTLGDDAIAYLTSSPAERMWYTLAEIDRRWGSAVGYLDSIGVTDADLRQLRLNLVDQQRD